MIRKDLVLVEHNTKIGKKCPFIIPNVTEDTLFYLDNVLVGFYLKRIGGKAEQLLEIANHEFMSKNVPKTFLNRSDIVQAKFENPHLTSAEVRQIGTSQMSTILGSIPPKPHFKRTYGTMSSVHDLPKASNFIKAMLLLCNEAELILKNIMPEQYERQLEIFKEVPDKWKFGKLFTSSISNFNINAPYHRDTGNFKDTVNIILTKRENSHGGCLNVPDYGITIDQADNSMLVYPAWLNIHGVTPIQPTREGGYRNSLIFYPLKAFKNLEA